MVSINNNNRSGTQAQHSLHSRPSHGLHGLSVRLNHDSVARCAINVLLSLSRRSVRFRVQVHQQLVPSGRPQATCSSGTATGAIQPFRCHRSMVVIIILIIIVFAHRGRKGSGDGAVDGMVSARMGTGYSAVRRVTGGLGNGGGSICRRLVAPPLVVSCAEGWVEGVKHRM